MKNTILVTFVIALSWLMTACGGGGGNGNGTPNPNAGFRMLTYAGTGNAVIPTAGRVQGQFLQANGSTTGTVDFFNYDHSGVGYLVASGAKVPARWRLTLSPLVIGGGSLCLTASTTERDAVLNGEETLICPPRFFSFTASPNAIDALNPPSNITFNGKGVENVHGIPTLAFYDEFGNVVASTQASQLLWNNNDIEGVIVVVPNISQVYDGVYTVVIHNINADGTLEIIGASSLTIYGNPPPPPPPPPGGEECGQPLPNMPQLPCNQS